MNKVEDQESTSARKSDHIEMAFRSKVAPTDLDDRFYYEPLLEGHPQDLVYSLPFLGKTLSLPIWVSSMTGGTEKAGHINRNLARACNEFGMGMGLGSCRSLLSRQSNTDDFDVRDLIGPDLPLYGNLGIAQVEEMVQNRSLDQLEALVDQLRLDGMIIHINPLQEALQPEGDLISRPPLETLMAALEIADCPFIVKEVGQGMGPKSLEQLLQLPLAAIDFAAGGGTNFAKLEMLRAQDSEHLQMLTQVGHSAPQMVDIVNDLVMTLGDRVVCRQVIVSGGIRTYLDGYYLINKLTLPAIYGMASEFLRHALGDYQELQTFVRNQAHGLSLAKVFLKVK